MENRGSDKLRRTADLVTVGCTPVGVVLTAMGVLLAAISIWVVLAGPPEIRGALSPFLDWVRRWWLAAIVLGAVAATSGVLLGVPQFRRRVFGGLKRLARAIQRMYLWMIWRLVVRPARDRFGVEAWQDADGMDLSWIDVVRPKVRHLEDDDLTLLARVLGRRKSGSSEVWVQWPDVNLDPPAPEEAEAERRFQDALENLRAEGVVTYWSSGDLLFGIRFPIAGSGALERLYVVVEAEIARRTSEGGDTAPEEEGLDIVVRRLPWLALQILAWMLEEYDSMSESPQVWGVFREEFELRGWSPVEMRKQVAQACDQLVTDGLLSGWQYSPEDDSFVEIELSSQVLEVGILRVRQWAERTLQSS